MMQATRNIVIVGGGTAGWLSAAYFSRALGFGRKNGTTVTLIEASDEPSIGVGEATVPLICQTMDTLGLDEAEFMRETSATFKLAIRFDDWLHEPSGDERHSYYHAFGVPRTAGFDFMAPYWVLANGESRPPFAKYCMLNAHLCDAYRAPKRPGDPPFRGPLVYAYHFDAGRLADFLKRKCAEVGVIHVVDRVLDVERGDDGLIEALVTEASGRLTGDLFLDCTGFAARLIEGRLGSEFTSFGDMLFCDRAVALQVPHADANQPIPPYTTATARKAGWIWDISLNERRGTGHVYSSAHMDADEAEAILRDYLGGDTGTLEARHIRMRVGYREQQWIGNCISVGLAAGFLEPLESTGIFLIEQALMRIGDLVPPFATTESLHLSARRFNRQMAATFTNIAEFLKLHYCLSRRTDSPFWDENRDPATWPATLRDNLREWQSRTPGLFDFPSFLDPFKAISYQQILLGMDYLPDLGPQRHKYRYADDADAAARQVQEDANKAAAALPDHRALIDQICGS